MSEDVAEEDYCETAARRDDPDRWLASLFAPDAARPDLNALLAFNGELARTREQVSQAMLGEIRLQWWRDAIEGIYAGNPRAHPVVRTLAQAVARHDLARPLFDRLIDARTDDQFVTELLRQKRYSLLWESTSRWVDARRFNRLATLPRDNTTEHVVHASFPIPESEELTRGGNIACQ